MLKMAAKEDAARLERFCSKYPIGTRIACCMAAYGFDRDFFHVWFSKDSNGEINAVVGSFFDAVTVCANDSADFKEIYEFINMYGYDSVCGEAETILSLGFSADATKRMFRYCRAVPYSAVLSCDESKLKSAYELICSVIPNSFSSDKDAYFAWLSDFTFRQKRSLARIKAVCVEETVQSCALTAAESSFAAIISGVACDPAIQGKGLGKNTVLSLVDELANENKQVYVIALNDSAGAFYEKIGFKQCCKIAYVNNSKR